mmetsp:Transcript_4723/g.16475  ORF Transcript_4723/g.16475 Transcript_4723/m.16475 type:complete len:91 (-) Transcript_4723:1263-1535(-)
MSRMLNGVSFFLRLTRSPYTRSRKFNDGTQAVRKQHRAKDPRILQSCERLIVSNWRSTISTMTFLDAMDGCSSACSQASRIQAIAGVGKI